MIISLCNQKGGVGKTTLAINIARYIAGAGHKILLIDADPQGSVLQWQGISDNGSFDVEHYPQSTIHKDIKKLGKGYKHVIIDSPPGVGDISLSILLTSNLTVIPVEPSALSIWASTDIVDLIKEAKKHNKKLKGKLLISKKIVGTTPGREAREALKSDGMGMFKTEICQRIDFVKSIIAGLTVIDYAPNSEAAKEIKSLCYEIAKK